MSDQRLECNQCGRTTYWCQCRNQTPNPEAERATDWREIVRHR